MDKVNKISGFVSKAQLAQMYKMSSKSISRLLREHETRLSAVGYSRKKILLSPKIMLEIIEIIGPPEIEYSP